VKKAKKLKYEEKRRLTAFEGYFSRIEPVLADIRRLHKTGSAAIIVKSVSTQ
jgi:hypothetical protein